MPRIVNLAHEQSTHQPATLPHLREVLASVMKQSGSIQSVSAAPLKRGGELLFFRRLLLVLLVFRLVYGGLLQLVPDEAYYWVWSRHLAMGYFDHPPMIAYVIWAGTHLLHSTELGVRFGIILMSIGAMGIIVSLGKRILRDSRATVWLAILWLTSPLLMALGTICTPDTPAMFFSVCALYFVTLIADRDDAAADSDSPGLWILFGIFSGLALLSKYTGVLLPAAVAVAMLTSPRGRAHYRRPWIYLSGLLTLAVFSPVIVWNKQHGWASFLFQLHHGTMDHAALAPRTAAEIVLRFFKDLGTYVGDQSLVWTPVLFLLAIVVLWHFWRRYRTVSQVDRLLLWCGTVPLVFFGMAAVQAHHTEANWPAFSYFPVSLLTVRWLSETWSDLRLNWVRLGVNIALVVLIVMHVISVPKITREIVEKQVHIPHAFADLLGWREYGTWLGTQSDLAGGAMVVTNKHQDAGEAAFYMPGQPEVWCSSLGTRPTAFDYFDEHPDFAKMPRVVWVGGNANLFSKQYGYDVLVRSDLTVLPRSKNARTFVALVLGKSQR
ncbi:MAG TPA: glycosyltransferase family 39 protein [Tepidisphaeraceae bacterium]|nr:glycosyltransferase family 39 protein [Tepidisphaeraceae bacterium]